MYKLVICLTAAVIAAGVPASQLELAKQDSLFEDPVQKTSTILDEEQVIQEVGMVQSEKQKPQKGKKKSDELEWLVDKIVDLIKNPSYERTARMQQVHECISPTTVNEIWRGITPNQYIVFNNKYSMYNIQAATNDREWNNAYAALTNEVEDKRLYELWLNYAPNHFDVRILTTSIFDHYKDKPTIYIAHLAPPGTNLESCARRIGCLQYLVNQGYTIKEWDWSIFYRLTRIKKCKNSDNDSSNTDLEHRLFESTHLNGIKLNNDLGNLNNNLGNDCFLN